MSIHRSMDIGFGIGIKQVRHEDDYCAWYDRLAGEGLTMSQAGSMWCGTDLETFILVKKTVQRNVPCDGQAYAIQTATAVSERDLGALKDLCKELQLDESKIGWYLITSVS